MSPSTRMAVHAQCRRKVDRTDGRFTGVRRSAKEGMTPNSESRSMHQKEFSVREVLAGQAPQNLAITVKGWVRTRRDSKAGISFVHLSDGSSFHPLQVVAPNTLVNYESEVMHLTPGCAVEATGAIVPSPAKGQPFEMQASAIQVTGWVD